jgi:hypothetical protein
MPSCTTDRIEGLKGLRRRVRLKLVGRRFAGKEPAADHPHTEMVDAIRYNEWHRNDTQYLGGDARSLAYAAETFGIRRHESHWQLRQWRRCHWRTARTELNLTLVKIKLELDRLRAEREYAESKRLREGRHRANGAGKELCDGARRAQEPLRYLVGSDRYSGESRVLNHNIKVDLASSRGQLAYFGLLDRIFIRAHRVAAGTRSQHVQPGPTIIADDQALVDGAGRRRTPLHDDQRCHLLPHIHGECVLPRQLPELDIEGINHAMHGRTVRWRRPRLGTLEGSSFCPLGMCNALS